MFLRPAVSLLVLLSAGCGEPPEGGGAPRAELRSAACDEGAPVVASGKLVVGSGARALGGVLGTVELAHISSDGTQTVRTPVLQVTAAELAQLPLPFTLCGSMPGVEGLTLGALVDVNGSGHKDKGDLVGEERLSLAGAPWIDFTLLLAPLETDAV